MTTPESELKLQIKKYLDKIGAYWSAVKGGSHAKPGDPDIIACYKGRFVAIEGKTPTGSQSGVQKLREKQIKAAGGVYILARSVNDVKKVCEEMTDAE